MGGVPAGLARDALDDVRVDLGQRVVARDRAEGVRQGGVAPGVVERVARLVQEVLVVLESALGARDQVHDRRGVGGDDARSRRLLRAVLEVGADVPVLLEVAAERAKRLDADPGGTLLRVDVGQRGEPEEVRGVVRGRPRRTARTEQAVEPAPRGRRTTAPCARRRSPARWRASWSEICFSASLRATGSATPESSACRLSDAWTRPRRRSLSTAETSQTAGPSSSRSS